MMGTPEGIPLALPAPGPSARLTVSVAVAAALKLELLAAPPGCEGPPLPISRAASPTGAQGFAAVPVWGPRESDKEEAVAVTVRVQ